MLEFTQENIEIVMDTCYGVCLKLPTEVKKTLLKQFWMLPPNVIDELQEHKIDHLCAKTLFFQDIEERGYPTNYQEKYILEEFVKYYDQTNNLI
jgi:hypothetical protein